MGLLFDFDESGFPKSKTKGILLNAVNGVKGGVQLAQKLHQRVERINRVRTWNDAQRKARDNRDLQYLKVLQLRYKNQGLLDDVMQNESGLKDLAFEAVERNIKQSVSSKLFGKKGKSFE